MENLLDEHNIEAELPSNLLLELKGAGRWLLISTVTAILIGLVFILISANVLLENGLYSMLEYIIFGGILLSGVGLFFFAYYQFRYSRAVQWLEVDSGVYTFDDTLRWGHKMWRSLALILLIGTILIIAVNFMAFRYESMDSPKEEPAILEPIMLDEIGADTIVESNMMPSPNN